ncbi:hypothetical protein [Dactylosporangium sp. NPDC049140]|jgi:hypothetical protein|uniref:hypothetical protein n=1 Tax=Dactylosporangium sp. NPDC049140 TaxID=3155647 RepID=UPI0033D78302
MMTDDADADLRRLAGDAKFPHRDAARRAVRFRESGDVADLLAVNDDPHPCGMTEVLFALAGSQRPWLNWVPMPSEAVSNGANDAGARIAGGARLNSIRIALSAAEPASAMVAARRVMGDFRAEIGSFPEPDIRVPLRRGRYAVWRYDGDMPVPAVPAPSAEAVERLHEVGGEAWASPLSGYLQAKPLGELPLPDLLGLLAHLPEPPATPRWEHLAKSTPMYWYRLMQPWVCLGLLSHAADEPWAGSTRRAVLTDLALGIEDWVADAALFALVTAAYRDPAVRTEVRDLVRARLDAAARAPREVTIELSLARLMLITPGSTAADHALARQCIARITGDDEPAPRKRRWWQRAR